MASKIQCAVKGLRRAIICLCTPVPAIRSCSLAASFRLWQTGHIVACVLSASEIFQTPRFASQLRKRQSNEEKQFLSSEQMETGTRKCILGIRWFRSGIGSLVRTLSRLCSSLPDPSHGQGRIAKQLPPNPFGCIHIARKQHKQTQIAAAINIQLCVWTGRQRLTVTLSKGRESIVPLLKHSVSRSVSLIQLAVTMSAPGVKSVRDRLHYGSPALSCCSDAALLPGRHNAKPVRKKEQLQ